ncbi:MAG: T9SS type A sorting domain-containing protein, partial [Saprospiraceae bacterium]|nr:T9SS type A sorting domain-containing protein [Saprospiraceae bacterium]
VSTDARTLDMYDQWGKKIKSQKLGTESAFYWNLSDLINGIYYLKLTGGKEVYSVQRIVIQH